MRSHHDSPLTRQPRILWLDGWVRPPAQQDMLINWTGEVGGAADRPTSALSRLVQVMRLGLPGPAGFVLLDARQAPPELADAYQALGRRPVVVRSLADRADGAIEDGQEIHQEIRADGSQAVAAAVDQCLAAAPTAPVLVSLAVSTRAHGRVLTVDPTAPDDDVLLVEVADSEPIILSRSRHGQRPLRRSSLIAGALTAAELDSLAGGALQAERITGHPLELTWVVADTGLLHWLSARPIDGAGRPPADGVGLDSDPVTDHVYAAYHVGETLPGPVTPLTLSLVGAANDRGLIDSYRRAGVYRRGDRPRAHVVAFDGHLFVDMTATYAICAAVAGTRKEHIDMAIAGRALPGDLPGPSAPRVRRLLNLGRYLRWMLGARGRLIRFGRVLAAAPTSDPSGLDTVELVDSIRRRATQLVDAYEIRVAASAGAGALHGVLDAVIARRDTGRTAQLAAVSAILGRVNGIANATVAAELERIADEVTADPEAVRQLTTMDAEAAGGWLAGHRIGTQLDAVVERYGFLGVHEAELRHPDWRTDRTPLVEVLRSIVTARGLVPSSRRVGNHAGPDRAAPASASASASQRTAASEEMDTPPRGALRAVVTLARTSLRQRDYAKSLCLQVTSDLKIEIRELAARLVADGRLPDDDLAFFLTVDEFIDLAGVGAHRREADGVLVRRALERRHLHARYATMVFPPVSVGRPQPRPLDLNQPLNSGALRGLPVNGGRITAPIRVIRRPVDITAMRPGEILAAPAADPGWAPYYALAAGLACDLGSPLSFGAVVARECGLPTVVNLGTATTTFDTGDIVVLDGDRGSLVLR